MDIEDLKAAIEAELDGSTGDYNSELATQRSNALKYYLGQPRGDEVPNRSHVISTDVADALDWILAQVMKAFSEADGICQFQPFDEQDVPKAEQESDYIEHVFWQKNNGFLIAYTLCKDALLSKNGYALVYWDESEEVTTETYTGLDPIQYQALLQDEELEEIEHTEYTEVIPTPQGPVEALLHDVEVKRTRTMGKCEVMSVPPENTHVAEDHNSVDLDEARFVAHEREMTRSELKEMGIDPKLVDRLPTDDDVYDEQDYARDAFDETGSWQKNDSKDPSMETITVYDITMRVDYDGDGVAELRHILYGGKEVLENEEIDYSGWVSAASNILTHKHNGISVYDRLKEIQDQKTAILRNVLDNHYLVNNQRYKVLSGGKVNLDDLLDSRPGGAVRVKQMDALEPLTVHPLGAQGFQIIDYLDRVRYERTGAGPGSANQEVPLPNDTAHGLERIMSAKEELVGMMIRLIAETGFKKIFRKMHSVIRHNQDIADVVELRRKWVSVDPREWRERHNLSVRVGLGTGDRMRQQQALQGVFELQGKYLDVGGFGIIVNPDNMYNAAEDYVKLAGQRDPSRYFSDPNEPQAQQRLQQLMAAKGQEGEAQQELQKAYLQVEGQRNQIRAMEEQRKSAEAAHKAQMDELSARMQQMEFQLKREAETAKAQTARDKVIADYEAKMEGLQNELTELRMMQSKNSRELDIKEQAEETRRIEAEARRAEAQMKIDQMERQMAQNKGEYEERNGREAKEHEHGMTQIARVADATVQGLNQFQQSQAQMIQVLQSMRDNAEQVSTGQYEAIMALADNVSRMAEQMNQPKRLVRDSEGKPVGVETVSNI